MGGSHWDGPNYARYAGETPFDKPPEEYDYAQRRGEIYRLIEDAGGHPHNLERSQQQLADRFGVSQQTISNDIQVLSEYEAAHNGTRAKAVTSMLSEKVVMAHIEAAQDLKEMGKKEEAADRLERAMNAQMRYDQYLFREGTLEEAADELKIEGDAGQAYMAMLEQAAEEEKG